MFLTQHPRLTYHITVKITHRGWKKAGGGHLRAPWVVSAGWCWKAVTNSFLLKLKTIPAPSFFFFCFPPINLRVCDQFCLPHVERVQERLWVSAERVRGGGEVERRGWGERKREREVRMFLVFWKHTLCLGTNSPWCVTGYHCNDKNKTGNEKMLNKRKLCCKIAAGNHPEETQMKVSLFVSWLKVTRAQFMNRNGLSTLPDDSLRGFSRQRIITGCFNIRARIAR